MLLACVRGAGMRIHFPDVCLTPPAGAPVPYVNLASHASAVPFGAKTYMSFVNALNMASVVPLTTGDQAGTMSPFMGPSTVTTGHPTIYIEALPGLNLLCPTSGNSMIASLGAVLVPDVVNVFFSYAMAGAAGRGAAGREGGERPEGGDLDGKEDGCLAGAGAVPAAGGAIPVDGELLAALARAVGPSGGGEAGGPGGLEERVFGDVACLRIPVLSCGVGARVHDALRRLAPRALVLDLRGCPGGDVRAAIDLAAEFLPEGAVIATLTDEDGDETVYRSRCETPCALPLVVLVDGRTASAAEVLAGSLKAHGRAAVIGERTFGKGVVQEVLPGAGGNGAHHATVATVTLPDGTGIQGIGVEPDAAPERAAGQGE